MGIVEIEHETIVFNEFFQIKKARLRFQKFSGAMSRAVTRLSLERGDSVAALILRPAANTIVLVNQFKYPTFAHGPGWMTEVVAGGIAQGEAPEQAVRREVLEETGFKIRALEPIATFYVSPGGSSERVFLFFAEVDERAAPAAMAGSASEDEDIQRLEFSPPELFAMLDRNELVDAKTMVAVQWLRRRMGAG